MSGDYAPETLSHNGLEMGISRFFAFLDPDTGEWDAADAVPAMRRHHHWRVEDERLDKLEQMAREVWDQLPESNRAWLKMFGAIRLRDIVAIDEVGDDLFEGAHVYVPFSPTNGPFYGFMRRLEIPRHLHQYGSFDPGPAKRIDRRSNKEGQEGLGA
jgi:hypothetical protein